MIASHLIVLSLFIDRIGTSLLSIINRIHSPHKSWHHFLWAGTVESSICPIKVGVIPASSLNAVPTLWLNELLNVVASILLFFISTISSQEHRPPSPMPYPNDDKIAKMAACIPNQAQILHCSHREGLSLVRSVTSSDLLITLLPPSSSCRQARKHLGRRILMIVPVVTLYHLEVTEDRRKC